MSHYEQTKTYLRYKGFSCQNTDCHKHHKVNEGNVRFAYMSG